MSTILWKIKSRSLKELLEMIHRTFRSLVVYSIQTGYSGKVCLTFETDQFLFLAM
jgi:hypothetical protein